MTLHHLGLDAGQRERADLEHLLARAGHLVVAAGLAVRLAGTHVVGTDERHWAGALELVGDRPDAGLVDRLAAQLPASVVLLPGGADGGAREAATQLRDRSAGRLVQFPGQDRLVGTVPADDVPRLSAVEQVVGLAGTATVGAALQTRGFVRPELSGGRIVLLVRPFVEDGTVAPFETEHPTPCCAAHDPRPVPGTAPVGG
ncbi:hypothetical protein [Klenkia terrae]|uniref:hypothetical protein n=1 Tax=Klenkia terrae TaxID=1052259 RepID=UPI001CD85655|nr:hypothetical protein [Klenkia terrae]